MGRRPNQERASRRLKLWLAGRLFPGISIVFRRALPPAGRSLAELIAEFGRRDLRGFGGTALKRETRKRGLQLEPS